MATPLPTHNLTVNDGGWLTTTKIVVKLTKE